MKGGILPFATITPFATPMSVVDKTASSIAAGSGIPLRAIHTVNTVTKLTCAPRDRSVPCVRTIHVCPNATIINGVA